MKNVRKISNRDRQFTAIRRDFDNLREGLGHAGTAYRGQQDTIEMIVGVLAGFEEACKAHTGLPWYRRIFTRHPVNMFESLAVATRQRVTTEQAERAKERAKNAKGVADAEGEQDTEDREKGSHPVPGDGEANGASHLRGSVPPEEQISTGGVRGDAHGDRCDDGSDRESSIGDS